MNFSKWILVTVFLAVPMVFAQNQWAKAVGEYPYVYAQPDFNAPVLAELERGKNYVISKQKFSELFYKVSVKPGLVGYVSDVEVQVQGSGSVSGNPAAGNALGTAAPKNPINKAGQNKKPTAKKVTRSEPAKPDVRKPFYATRYRGLIVENMNYAEDTMSKHRTESLTFFGYRVSGFNTMFSGEMSTDASILVYFGAPKYYQEITGQPATGWIIHTDFTFDTLYPQGKNHLISYGFGPMFKYSHIVASLKNTTNAYNTDYPMDDMTLGVLLRLGIAFRINNMAIKSDVKYYMEAQRYLALNLSALFAF